MDNYFRIILHTGTYFSYGLLKYCVIKKKKKCSCSGIKVLIKTIVHYIHGIFFFFGLLTAYNILLHVEMFRAFTEDFVSFWRTYLIILCGLPISTRKLVFLIVFIMMFYDEHCRLFKSF